MWTVSSGFSNALLKMQLAIDLAPVSLSNNKVNFYTCPRLTFLEKNAAENARLQEHLQEPLGFKTFWRVCPQTPLKARALDARNLPRLVL